MGDVGTIDPSLFAGAGVDPDAVSAAAVELSRGARAVRDGGAEVLAQWRQLAWHYEAPEADRLLAAMDPVERESDRFADHLEAVATALHRYADDVRPVLDLRRMLTIQAEGFVQRVAADARWQYDQGLVDEHMGLMRSANDLQVQLWDAERRCANAIRASYGAVSFRASTGSEDPRGYGWAEIPAEAEMPWGSPVRRRDDCAKAAFVQVKHFVWDGVVWDGVMGGLKGVLALVGVGDETDGSWGWSHSWQSAGQTWSGLTVLAGYDDGTWSAGTAGDAWLGMGEGLLSWDTWEDDPGRAGGGAVFNVASLVMPLVGLGKVASTLGTAGRAGAAARSAAGIVEPSDVAADVASGAGLGPPPDLQARFLLRGPDELVESVTTVDGTTFGTGPSGIPAPNGLQAVDVTPVPRRNPRSSANFLPPTNAPEPPPIFIPQGYELWVSGPTPDYPTGYWRLRNEHGQPIDPGAGRPPANVSGARAAARTHVPLPHDWQP
ncbi:WXG100 family type VII secretion target [Actinotalea sp. Marseille-Q4924]|uniref:WXG100 family type VII secretion target n=1 Tax=Actinotalea sp. Marseille-Q4924 TaxID=2866571 RepID=UPI001CE432AF|nr:hypothetical protein [Actinotalea sp. Marseille-Q4924]